MQLLAFLLMLAMPAAAQRIDTHLPDRAKVIRLETAMNHLTVIEFAEPVMLAAAGSPLFKIERRENKVFIQPLEEGASTNLFVWTDSGRWNYELVPAESVETMHFAIDQRLPPPAQTENTATTPAKTSAASRSFAEEMLLFARPIRNLGVKSAAAQIGVSITDVYRKDDQLLIRYVVDNRTARPYVAGPPEVFALESPRSPTSLYSFRYSQLDSGLSKRIDSLRENRIALIECEIPSESVPVGEAATGILIVPLPALPSDNEPSVLRLVFPADQAEPISLTLVL